MTKQRVKSKFNNYLHSDVSHPLLVYLVSAGVAGKGLHVTRTFLEHTQVFVAVFQEHVLVVKVVAGKQKPHVGREREQAVLTVGGKTLVTGIRTHAPRQVFRVRERVQAHPFVAHAQNLGPQLDVLKRSRLREREGKVPLQQARTIRRTRDLVPREADKGQETRIVQNTLELFRRLQEFCRRFPVYLFGNDVAPAEGREVLTHVHTLPRRFRQVEEAGVGQERTLVEMPLVTAGEETHVPLARGRAVTLADEVG